MLYLQIKLTMYKIIIAHLLLCGIIFLKNVRFLLHYSYSDKIIYKYTHTD